jgi:two-component system, response regulator PdtaR
MSFLNAEEMNSYDQSSTGEKVPSREVCTGMADTAAFIAGKHCLVIDDEFLIALDLQQALETADAIVTCIGDCEAALQALDCGIRFDLAVLDIKLSGGAHDSKHVAAALTAQGTPFVFLTGLRADNDLAKAFPHAPLVEKPYRFEVLMEALRRALAGSTRRA